MVPNAAAVGLMLMASSALTSVMVPVPIGFAIVKRPVPVRAPGKLFDIGLGDGVAGVVGTVPETDFERISLS